MAEKQGVPPTRKPVSEFPTPDPSVAFYTELVNRDDPAYIANAPVKRGSLYSTMVGAKRDVISQYPNLFFLQETKLGLSDQQVLWHWATDEKAHDTYNSTVSYVSNAVTYPAFTRTYTIRRELYEQLPTLPIGSPLPGIVSVTIDSPGEGYSKAAGVIDGTTVAVEFTVDDNGKLLSGIITNTGEEIIQDGTEISIIGDGVNATATAVAQPVGCVLTQQTKQELGDTDPTQHELVQVVRVYETLPGPWIYSVRIDKDGALVTAKTRRQIADFITDEDLILNGEWVQTFHKGTDNFVAEETIESRPLPGNPIITTRVEEDGMVMTITKILIDASTGTSGETLTDGIWTTTKKEELASTTFVKDTSASEKVCWLVSEARAIPGNPVVSTKVDEDGFEIDVVKTLKATTAIVTQETLVGGVWTRTESEAVTDLVANEVVTAREVPGAAIPSASVDGDSEVATSNKVIKDTTLITPSATESGGVITTVEKKERTDLVSDQITTQVEWLDKSLYSLSIPNLIPESFRPTIPTHVESHVVAGIAAEPTLGFGELERSERQLTALLKEVRVTSFGNILYPLVQIDFQNIEEYGGGQVGIVRTLNDSPMVPDQGLFIVDSDVKTIFSDGVGGGVFLKETSILYLDTEWSELSGTEVDPRTGISISVTKQVVAAGTTGGVSGNDYIDVKPIDKWRSIQIVSSLDPSSLPNTLQWETTVENSFQNTLVSATFLWAAVTGSCCYEFDSALELEITEGYAGPCRARITESFSNGPPVDAVSITQFFPQGYTIGYAWAVGSSGPDCNMCKANARTWGIPPTLHPAITIAGGVILSNGTFTSTLPATNPTGLPAPGTLITKDVNVEQWRFGVFFRRVTEIFVPG